MKNGTELNDQSDATGWRIRALSRRWLGIVLLVIAFSSFVLVDEFSSSLWLFYGVWFVAWAGLVLSWWRGQGAEPGTKQPVEGSISERGGSVPASTTFLSSRKILAVALLLRLLALMLPLTLSDDIYRYIWDGRVVLSGSDPYALTPDSPRLEHLRDPLWEKTAHRDVETVYPPVAQGLFALGAILPAPLVGLRVLWLLVDLATCALLLRLIVILGFERRNAILYAWNPLVVLEGVGMGHVDVAGTFALVLALTLALMAMRDRASAGESRSARAVSARAVSAGAVSAGTVSAGTGTSGRSSRWSLLAGVGLAVGVLIKLVPVVLVPLFLLATRPLRFLAAFGITLTVALLPIVTGVGVPPGLLRYGISWEFNGAIFEPLWRLLDSTSAIDWAKAQVTWVGGLGVDVSGWYRFVYPQFLAKLVLLALLTAAVLGLFWLGFRRSRIDSRGLHGSPRAQIGPVDWLRLCQWTLVLAMLCTATLYPWYVLWVLPLAAALRSWPVLLLSFTLAFAYLPQVSQFAYFPWVWGAVWLPPLALAVVFALRGKLETQWPTQ